MMKNRAERRKDWTPGEMAERAVTADSSIAIWLSDDKGYMCKHGYRRKDGQTPVIHGYICNDCAERLVEYGGRYSPEVQAAVRERLNGGEK